MADREKQHFVPKFYLKRFSIDNGEKQIGIFSKKKELFIKSGSLKGQAYKSFFYGKDGVVEDSLGVLENKFAPVIRAICDDGFRPEFRTREFMLLLLFVISTDIRNPIVSETFNQAFHNMMKAGYGKLEEFKELFEKTTIGIENAPRLALAGIDRGMKCCYDLEHKFLVNKSSTPFITSDNPVIKYNQFLESRGWKSSMTGYSSLGLQMIVPLNSQIAVLFYDAKIYKVGDKKKNVLHLDDVKNINDLNLLQFINSNNNIFFNHEMPKHEIFILKDKYQKYAKAHVVKTNEYENFYDEFGQKKNSSLVFTTFSDCCINLNIKGIKFTDYAKNKKLDDRAVQLRSSYDVLKKLGLI